MLVTIPRAHPETVPAKGTVDSRVREVTYSSEEVYRLQGFVGYQIDLQFEPGERFVGLGAGDLDGLSFVAADNHLFIKPKAPQVDTNLTVLTTRRPYQFAYTSSARHPQVAGGDVIYMLRFKYAPPVGQAPDQEDRVGSLLEPTATRRAPNIDYGYCGSSAIKPVAVSDDGIHTRLRFGTRSEQPAIFVRNEDGSESLLNFSMEAGDVVVHRVVRTLVVRRGRLVGRIVNKAFSGAGERLQSGTVSPAVQRAAKALPP